MSEWGDYVAAVGTQIHLSPNAILNELPYAQGRQFRDLAMMRAGVRLMPKEGAESAAQKFREALN